MSRILVVDDQDDIRRMLTLTLKGRHSVEEAADATAAWNTLESGEFDVVILDVMMPGEMDGLELCRRLKSDARFASLRVLLVTAIIYLVALPLLDIDPQVLPEWALRAAPG